METEYAYFNPLEEMEMMCSGIGSCIEYYNHR